MCRHPIIYIYSVCPELYTYSQRIFSISLFLNRLSHLIPIRNTSILPSFSQFLKVFAWHPSTLEACQIVRITTEMYDTLHQKYQDKITQISHEKQKYSEWKSEYELSIVTIYSLARRSREIFESYEVDEKKMLLRFLLQNPILDGKIPMYNLESPFDILLAEDSIKQKSQIESEISDKKYGMAPRIGFEPMTYRLTAGCSTAELSGNMSAMAPQIRFEPLLIVNSSREREHIMNVMRNVKIFSWKMYIFAYNPHI